MSVVKKVFTGVGLAVAGYATYKGSKAVGPKIKKAWVERGKGKETTEHYTLSKRAEVEDDDNFDPEAPADFAYDETSK